jgi:uncharacterized membrane-anchored protein
MRSVLGGIILALIGATTAAAQNQNQDPLWQQLNQLKWQFDGNGAIGTEATIRIPRGYAFLKAPDSRRFLEIMGNPPSDNDYIIGPENLHWFTVFEFEPIGYVRDDERLDPDGLLETLKQDNAAGLAERKRLGLSPLYLVGWYVPPHYDLQTKRLEWGIKLQDDKGEITVNYMSRILGRDGVMDTLLVSSPTSLDADMRDFKAILSDGYSFNPGNRYFEFRNGDKVAAYGLSALIVGGAAAAAAKSGAFKGLAKFLWVGVLAVFGGIISFFKRLFGSKKQSA